LYDSFDGWSNSLNVYTENKTSNKDSIMPEKKSLRYLFELYDDGDINNLIKNHYAMGK